VDQKTYQALREDDQRRKAETDAAQQLRNTVSLMMFYCKINKRLQSAESNTEFYFTLCHPPGPLVNEDVT